MLKIAITGGIACGKSAVAAIISDAGLPVCEADDLAHSAVMSGSSAYYKICAEFGNEVLDEKGEVSREKLGKIVFSSSEKLALLNSIVHPDVQQAWARWLDKLDEDGKDSVAVVVIPLLYEIDDQEHWDTIICVAASKAVQLKRLGDRGLSPDEAENRINAQLVVTDKMKRADYVIVNNAAKDILVRQTNKVLESIIRR